MSARENYQSTGKSTSMLYSSLSDHAPIFACGVIFYSSTDPQHSLTLLQYAIYTACLFRVYRVLAKIISQAQLDALRATHSRLIISGYIYIYISNTLIIYEMTNHFLYSRANRPREQAIRVPISLRGHTIKSTHSIPPKVIYII